MQHPILRALGLVALAALAFVAVASLTRPLVPLPEYAELQTRFDRFLAADEPYDLLFVGPSTTRCTFDPRIIDADLAYLGHSIRSANLGLPGASYFEIDHMIERIVARRPPGLRWLVIELHPPRVNIILRPNRYATRSLYWHTPRQLRDVLLFLSHPVDGKTLRVDLAAIHLGHALWRFASVGQGDRIVGRHLDPQPELDERRGFAPENCFLWAEHKRFRERDNLEAQIALQDHKNAQRVPTRRLLPGKVRRQVASLREIGVEPLYVLTPIMSPVPGIHSLRGANVLPNLIAFDSPARYPEFYDMGARNDHLHLNDVGAELFSHEFAAHFARWLEARPN